jgi:nucleotidyltransferase/DNA polymerase involved in DNA repair
MSADLKDLRRIPGVGPKMSEKLVRLGYNRVEDLKKADPAEMYARYSALVGGPVDRCVLHVWRQCVDFAQNPKQAGQKQWWEYKD